MRISSVQDGLGKLRAAGCHPGTYPRGDLFRFHVNIYGNYWADAPTPLEAMREAIDLWEAPGRPVDGAAALPFNERGSVEWLHAACRPRA